MRKSRHLNLFRARFSGFGTAGAIILEVGVKTPLLEDKRDLEWIKGVQGRHMTELSKTLDSKDESSIDSYNQAKTAHKNAGTLIEQREAELAQRIRQRQTSYDSALLTTFNLMAIRRLRKF